MKEHARYMYYIEKEEIPITEGVYTKKTEKPRRFAEASVIGWRRPTFPQIDAVSSALRGLTSLFGMGRGGPPRYSHHVSLYMS